MKLEELARWIKSLLISAIIFGLFSLYLYVRRGVYNDGIINKVLGSTSAVVAGLTLLIGPFAHRHTTFARLMPLRRELGLLAFAAALAHVYYSVFVLSERFTIAWYKDEITPIVFGGIAVTIWIYVAAISSNKSIKSLGSDAWRWRQKIGGHAAFLAVYLHLILLKNAGWMEWFQGKTQATPYLKNPQYIPASLFVFALMSGIIIYRLMLVFTRPKK